PELRRVVGRRGRPGAARRHRAGRVPGLRSATGAAGAGRLGRNSRLNNYRRTAMVTPLGKKLTVKDGCRVAAVDVPAGLTDRVNEATAGGRRDDAVDRADVVLVFGNTRAGLERRLPDVIGEVTSQATVWLLYPKVASGG